MAKLIDLKLIGFRKIKAEFRRLKQINPGMQREFMTLIANSTLTLLRANTPVDTGQLKAGWSILNRGNNWIDVGFRQDNLAERLFFVTKPTVQQRGNPFVDNILRRMLDLVIDTLEGTLKRGHKFYSTVNLRSGQSFSRGSGNRLDAQGGIGSGHPSKVGRAIGGRGRKFQQVGRTKATLTGHRQSGGAQVKRVGTGSKRLGRRLSLRRRRGKDIRAIVKASLG